MHSLEEMGPNVPAFLAKLWKMVEDPETNEFISWSASGTSFTIRNQGRFSRELLPVYYKHNNMASFVRQLNMYGFHKVVSIEGGGLKIDKDEMEFAHSCFLMGHPYLLEHIKRKIPAKFEEGRSPNKSDLVNKVLSEVKTMKGRQDNVDSQLSALKRENEVLWREVAILRQKHLKQQQIVNKLIQFLVSMVQSSRNGGLGIKRHYPLMLGDKAHVDATHHDSTQLNNKKKINSNSHHSQDLHDVPNHPSPSGPVIHELEATDLPDDCIPESTEETVGPDFLSVDLGEVTQGEVHSPASSSSKGSAPLNLNEPNCDVLLELVEDYPLSPEILTTASPAEVNPCITSSKNKSKAVGSKNKNCDRKKKTKRVQIKEEIMEPAEVNSLNVGDFLEIVLPNMEGAVESTLDPTVETILPTEPMDTAELDSINIMVGDTEQTSLDAATDAAISAISNVAAETSTAAAVAALEEAAVAAAAAAAAPSGVEAPRVAAGCKIPEESLEMQCVPQETVLPDSETPSDSSPNMTLACTNNSPGANSIKSKEELNSYVGNIQSDLDSLKDLLKGEGYSLDANTLLGLFSEDPMSFGLHFVNEDGKAENCNQNKENNPTDPLVSGGELATYSSNLLDLVDLNSGLDDWSLPDTETLENYTNDIDTPQILLPESPEFPNPPAKKRRK